MRVQIPADVFMAPQSLYSIGYMDVDPVTVKDVVLNTKEAEAGQPERKVSMADVKFHVLHPANMSIHHFECMTDAEPLPGRQKALSHFNGSDHCGQLLKEYGMYPNALTAAMQQDEFQSKLEMLIAEGKDLYLMHQGPYLVFAVSRLEQSQM